MKNIIHQIIVMAKNSKIEWTDHTVNLWWGCTKVHAGCDNCYAEYFSDVRYKKDLWGEGKPRKKIKKSFSDLDKYQKLAAKANEIHKVFVGSMMDIFEKPKPLIDHKGNDLYGTTTGDLRDILFANISDGLYPNLMFLLLTKRPSNINKYIPESWKSNSPKNVFFGCSPVDQKTFNTLVPQLCKVKGNLFLSIEPQLGSIDFWHIANTYQQMEKINWIIQGGESGHNKRPFEKIWAYEIRRQCMILKIPYFFKQIDKIQSIPEDLLIREFPKSFNSLIEHF